MSEKTAHTPLSSEPRFNPFAAKLDAAFSSAFPEWRGHAYAYQKWCGPGDPMDECNYFIPNPHGYGFLDVRSWRGSIRVSFEWYAKTWKGGAGPQQDATIAETIQFIRDLIDESVVIVYRKGLFYWLDKNLFKAVAEPSRAGRFGDGKRFLASRSWHGRWNRGELPRLRVQGAG
jgi:hypothetical protein